LEGRLRGLILNHPSPDPSVQYPPPPAHENLFPGAPVPQFASQGSNPPNPPPGLEPVAAPGPALPNADSTNKKPRKRMNQAERRQASSQLSIPIGPRAQVPPTPQSAGLYSKSPGQQLQSGTQYEHHGPRSAPFRGNRDTPCKFMVLYGRCRNQDQGCPFNHDVNRAAAPGASAQSHSRNQSFHSYNGPPSSRRTLFDPSSPRNPGHSYNNSGQYQMQPEDVKTQTDLLEGLCHSIIANAEITIADIAEKENFRIMIESVARDAICRYEREQNGVLGFPPESVQLRCFGSLSSGFATKDADMDLGLLSPLSRVQPDSPNSPIPRLVEKAFLDLGLGARLLTRTRVPIIKICEKPPSSLLAALLEERAKWDRGLDGNTEKVHEADVAVEADETVHEAGSRLPARTGFPSLRQGKMSLQSYYSFAKALLKRLGGRDLTAGTLGNFTEADYCFINDFSREFVDGLADSELRDRLQRYPSLRLQDYQNHRTLYGVHAQIEGEKLVMVWESRAIGEKDEYLERQARRHLTAWQELQYSPEYGRDSLRYNRELVNAVEHLKTIPTIQLSQHSQTQHESAVSYHHRTSRLLADLGGFDTPSPKNQLLPSVVRQYIQGIYLPEIRKQMQEFAESRPGVSLRTVARNHKALQLAHDYEKCLQKGLYPDEAVHALIGSYVKVLRAPMTLAQVPGRNFDNFVVSYSDELAGKGPELLRLGNPSKMAPNQPRDPYRDKLEFPKSGVGVQCDINFSAHLGLQNTLLLRCYSHCDPRVRPLVLFVKHWAKVRGINTPYRGSLSSYGYVLMMLHYLVNVAQPFVCPNLQLLAPPPDPNLSPQQIEETVTCKGRNVRFWRDEQAIKGLAQANALTQNRQTVGELLRGFFEYYAHFTAVSSGQGQGFDWGRDVISLRTPGGLLSKQEKGWTGAKTVIEEVISPREPPSSAAEPVQDDAGVGQQEPATTAAAVSTPTTAQPARETKEVRYRYLFAIEDPFELDHNVARTVTHNGIVSIRDEFRRAWRIIKNAGKSSVPQEDLLEDLALAGGVRDKEEFQKLLAELHGSTWNTVYCSPADAQNEVKTGSGAE
ncbi:Poly(A) RNA polymerase protein cid1, partial [Rhypophila sp. PSN 637]